MCTFDFGLNCLRGFDCFRGLFDYDRLRSCSRLWRLPDALKGLGLWRRLLGGLRRDSADDAASDRADAGDGAHASRCLHKQGKCGDELDVWEDDCSHNPNCYDYSSLQSDDGVNLM